MKRLVCFQEVGEIVQPAEDAVIEVSNGLSICGEMVGVGGVKSTRTFMSMELKFTGKGANFISVALSSSQAAQAIMQSTRPRWVARKLWRGRQFFSPNAI